MAKKFLDDSGLGFFWTKVKSYIDEHDYKLNYTTSGKNYKVVADGNKNLYVNVPWTDNDTTYEVVTTTSDGLMSSSDKSKLDGIEAKANNYIHPVTPGNKHIPSGGSAGQILRWSADGTAVWGNDNNTTYGQANSTTLGLVKIGFPESGKNYPVELNSSGQMYVNVPWTDTTYTLSSFGITATSNELNYCKGVTSNIQTQINNKADTDQTMYLGTTPVAINRRSSTLTLNSVNISGNAGYATYAGYIDRERNANTVYTLTSLPTSKALVIANLSYATTISVSSGMSVGDSITVICNPSYDFTQPIPNSGSYKSMDGDSLKVTSGKPFEINIICYAVGSYSISCKVSK